MSIDNKLFIDYTLHWMKKEKLYCLRPHQYANYAEKHSRLNKRKRNISN